MRGGKRGRRMRWEDERGRKGGRRDVAMRSRACLHRKLREEGCWW